VYGDNEDSTVGNAWIVADDDITAGKVGAEGHHDAARFRGRERLSSPSSAGLCEYNVLHVSSARVRHSSVLSIATVPCLQTAAWHRDEGRRSACLRWLVMFQDMLGYPPYKGNIRRQEVISLIKVRTLSTGQPM